MLIAISNIHYLVNFGINISTQLLRDIFGVLIPTKVLRNIDVICDLSDVLI